LGDFSSIEQTGFVRANQAIGETTREKSIIVIKQDRRSGSDRRKSEQGPPPGVGERRVTMQRRLFDIPLGSLPQWQQEKNSGTA